MESRISCPEVKISTAKGSFKKHFPAAAMQVTSPRELEAAYFSLSSWCGWFNLQWNHHHDKSKFMVQIAFRPWTSWPPRPRENTMLWIRRNRSTEWGPWLETSHFHASRPNLKTWMDYIKWDNWQLHVGACHCYFPIGPPKLSPFCLRPCGRFLLMGQQRYLTGLVGHVIF